MRPWMPAMGHRDHGSSDPVPSDPAMNVEEVHKCPTYGQRAAGALEGSLTNKFNQLLLLLEHRALAWCPWALGVKSPSALGPAWARGPVGAGDSGLKGHGHLWAHACHARAQLFSQNGQGAAGHGMATACGHVAGLGVSFCGTPQHDTARHVVSCSRLLAQAAKASACAIGCS